MIIDSKVIDIISKLVLMTVLTGLTLCVQSAKGDFIPQTSVPYTAIDPGRIKGRTPERTHNLSAPVSGMVAEQKIKPLPKPQENVAAVKFKLSDIVIGGVTVYKKGELLQYYKPFLGKDVSLSELQNIADTITARYRDDGYVLSRAILPAQQIEAGKVYVHVIEGYISAVYVEGDVSKVRSKIEKCGEKIKQMRPLQVKKLERYILVLNDIPGLEVKTVLSPAVDTVGASELTFVIEQRRVEADAYYDNRGSRYSGPDEVIASVSIGDAILGADNLSLQTIDTPLHQELRYLRLAYSLPLGINGLRINTSGSLTETKPGFTISDLGLIGRSKNWSIGVEYPLVRARTKKLLLYGKFDWLDSYTDFVGPPLYQDHIRSLRFGTTYDFSDSWDGNNLVNLELSKGMHAFGASPFDPKTPLSRKYAHSNYCKAGMNISRYQSLGARWMLVVAGAGQYGFNSSLLSAEEFGFGGPQFGRAYDPSELTGDSGVTGKLELRANTYPDWTLLQQVQYYTFYEMGVVWNIGGDLSQEPKDSGTDLGVGLRASFNKYLYGSFELARPLTRRVATQMTLGKNGRAWRMFFGLGVKL